MLPEEKVRDSSAVVPPTVRPEETPGTATARNVAPDIDPSVPMMLNVGCGEVVIKDTLPLGQLGVHENWNVSALAWEANSRPKPKAIATPSDMHTPLLLSVDRSISIPLAIRKTLSLQDASYDLAG
jgi:hypothetical protein